MKNAIEVFGEWAQEGKDYGMQKNHAMPVNEMIDFALEERKLIGKKFSFIDIGCGNGWVVRKVSQNNLCKEAEGIDGAKQMIAKAKLADNKNKYLLADLDSYKPVKKYDVIHSMEVLYYLKNPEEFICKIHNDWINSNGRLIVGIDLYFENPESHSWEENVGTRMHMLRKDDWLNIFKSSGFLEVKTWYSNQNEKWNGTLVLTGVKR